MDNFKTYPKPADDELDFIFREELHEAKRPPQADFSLERINALLQNGSISEFEHNALIKEFYPVEKKLSGFALASLLIAALNWVLILEFNYHDEIYQLLSAKNRYYVSLLPAPASLLFFFLAVNEIKTRENTKGFSLAIAGLTLALAILSIIIPVFLMKLA